MNITTTTTPSTTTASRSGGSRESRSYNVDWTAVGLAAAETVLSIYLSWKLAGWLTSKLDPNARDEELARKLGANALKRSGSGRKIEITDSYEAMAAQNLIVPDDIDVTFASVGGLEEQKKELYDLMVVPLHYPELFQKCGKLAEPPKGILLYGPPGTGKTMLARAIAKESGASFLNLQASAITSKWHGDSQKIVRATFSLARKLAPCIIFVDEMEAILRSREMDSNSGEQAVTQQIKAEFMACWDGLTSVEGRGFGVVVLGATNRPNDLDPAILRRMPRAFEIGLPRKQQRVDILTRTLQGEYVEGVEGVVVHVAGLTDGYTGNDLKEVCRAAASIPLKELLAEAGAARRKAQQQQEQQQQQPATTGVENDEEEKKKKNGGEEETSEEGGGGGGGGDEDATDAIGRLQGRCRAGPSHGPGGE